MTRVLDDAGRVRRSPEVVAQLHELVEGEPSLSRLVTSSPELMPWGSSGVHFAGRWSGPDAEVLLKVGVSDAQRFWSTTVAHREPGLAPRVLASGDRLSGTELGWVLMERLPSGLHDGWGGAEFTMLVDAGVRFQELARAIGRAPCGDTTADVVREWLVRGRDRGAPGPVDAVLERFADDWRFVERVCGREVCLGDLHLANALVRAPAPRVTPALLIDFEPCRTPWVFDAAYAQVLNSDPARAAWQDLVGRMAGRRRARGLPVAPAEELRRVSAVVLAWFALRMWGVLGPVPDPAWRATAVWSEQTEVYVRACAALATSS